jgi:hypothetical protein
VLIDAIFCRKHQLERIVASEYAQNKNLPNAKIVTKIQKLFSEIQNSEDKSEKREQKI